MDTVYEWPVREFGNGENFRESRRISGPTVLSDLIVLHVIAAASSLSLSDLLIKSLRNRNVIFADNYYARYTRRI